MTKRMRSCTIPSHWNPSHQHKSILFMFRFELRCDVLWIEWWNGQTFCLNTELLPKRRSNLLTIYHIHSQSHLFRSNTPCSIFLHWFFPLFSPARKIKRWISHCMVVIECKSLCCWIHSQRKNHSLQKRRKWIGWM